MKIALCTTTINVPHVLRLYRAHGPDVEIFIAADDKTPTMMPLVRDINAGVCRPDLDDKEWACSKLIGRNCIQRRNIAYLEALKWGAEIIVSVDDDNAPMDCLYFNEFKEALTQPFNGLMAQGDNWFDPGKLLLPPVTQRGIPHDNIADHMIVTFVTDAKVGVAQGLCLGDPDINAYERMATAPIAHGASELARAGIVVDPYTTTVFNSQSTAFLRELAPAMLLCPQFGRHDDIYASLITRRVMRETGHYVHYGKPFVYQQRNDHDLVKDFAAEAWGLFHIDEFAGWLDGLQFPKDTSVVEITKCIYEEMASFEWMPQGVAELARAWCQDVRSVL